jgi:hypothetical protein
MPELQNSEDKKPDWISSVLAGHMTPKELACALGVSERTLGRWHQFRQGPPRVELGRKVFYRSASSRGRGCQWRSWSNWAWQ